MSSLPDIQTEALQLFSAEEASYYRLLPFSRGEDGVVSCLGEEDRCRVRFRMDGKLMERHVIERSAYPAVVNRIKIMSGLDISETRFPQDVRILYSRDGVRFDIRTSVMPTIHGEKIVLRLLVSDRGRLSLESLGFDERQYRDYVEVVTRPHGMILISGPTGSGKSTTLYATLERLNRTDNNILTIEDPVEYTI